MKNKFINYLIAILIGIIIYNCEDDEKDEYRTFYQILAFEALSEEEKATFLKIGKKQKFLKVSSEGLNASMNFILSQWADSVFSLLIIKLNLLKIKNWSL